jgi:hypothetical protein
MSIDHRIDDRAGEHSGAEDDDYAGPATVVLDDSREVPVRVRLMAVHQPVDGRVHWFGRVAANAALAELLGAGADVRLRTGQRQAPARLGDVDPWGRYRVSGTGVPPFDLPAPPDDED